MSARAVRARSGLVALCAVVAGCAAAPPEPLVEPTALVVSPEAARLVAHFQADRVEPLFLVEGARVYDERCSPCHGDRGEGDGVLADVLPIRPRNYHADPFKWGAAPQQLVETIRVGRSDVMPPFEGALSEREMWAAAYLVWHWIPPERRRLDALPRPEPLRD